MIEKRQGVNFCTGRIAYRNRWIDKETLMQSAERYGNSHYGQHLKNVLREKLFIEDVPIWVILY